MVNTQIWDLRKYEENVVKYPKLNEIKETLLNDGLVAIPTETVYGLGANARNEHAVRKIYEAKGRPSDNPLIVHIHQREQLEEFVDGIDERVSKLMDVFGLDQFHLFYLLKQVIYVKSYRRIKLYCSSYAKS